MIAIHDVAPQYLDEIRFLTMALDAASARPRVLKIIPQHLLESPELVSLLREEQAHGSELVLHGFSHQVTGALRGPWPRRLRAAIFAPRDAEFLSLEPDEMLARLERGLEILKQAGLSVSGFSAPGWLAPPELRSALRRVGLRYDVTMTGVVDLANGRRVSTDWIGFMGSGPVQERLVGVANRINRRSAPLFRVVKIFLHPQSARRSAACRRILDLIPTMMQGRTLTTYGQLLTN